MKLSVLFHNESGLGDEKPREAKLPWLDAAYLTVDGGCPRCRAPWLEIRGETKTKTIDPETGHLFATAYALCCLQPIGTLKVESQSLFGADEDAKVLAGRVKVF